MRLVRRLQRVRHLAVHRHRLVALDKQRLMAIAEKEMTDFLVAHPAHHGRVGDLVAVQMQDRQHRAVARRIEKLVGVPGRGERPGLGLAVADDAGDQKVGIVEGRAVGVGERVAEFAAFVDRSRRLRRRMARNAAGERELPEQLAQTFCVAA